MTAHTTRDGMERTRRALELFDDAMAQPLDARDAWIKAAAAGDDALAEALQRLVASAARTMGILEATDPSAPPLRETLSAALADLYVLDREIGRGGMATVFRARERKHDRDVVIKVLDPAMTQVCGAERFLREVHIAATLAHPHIVQLIDSGDANGLLYYVMPWMGGETLRDRLGRGALDVATGRAILRDMADALVFAHRAGVVHRDLKPENVLLTGGHAYLLDFGIAKLLDASTSASRITSPGLPLGTRRYMAPEQAFAAADVDVRADIFAWGVLGCELLVGQREAITRAAVALRARRDVPESLIALLMECIATDPEQRPSTMADVLARLEDIVPAPPPVSARTRRGPVLLGMGAMALAIVAFVLLRPRSDADGAARAGSAVLLEPIAVTVMRNETADSTLDVLGRFAGDWITDGLQRMDSVRTVPWSESRLASERASSTGEPLIATVRDEAHAGTIVTGTYYLLNDSLHLQAQLIDAASERVVATLAPIITPRHQPEAGIAQLRDRVMGAIAVARDDRVAALPGVTRAPPSFSAYQAFDEGFDRYLAQQYQDAHVAFREAFRRDTTFTAALLFGARTAWNTRDFTVADSLMRLAHARERDLGPYYQASLRFIEALERGDGANARAAIERAAAIAPNSRAGFDHAVSLLNAGRARDAYVQLQRMDPDRGEMRGWGSYWTQRAHAEHLLGEHAAELQSTRAMAQRYPDRRVALVLHARALAAAGELRQLDSALRAWESLPADVYWSQGAAMVSALEVLLHKGNDADARLYGQRAVAWLTNRLVASPSDRAHRYFLGRALYALGRYNDARVYFEGLAREFPERIRYRGLAGLTAARRGDLQAAERWLSPAAVRDTGEVTLFRARFAAIAGDRERAIGLLTDAVHLGVDGFPWIPDAAFPDLKTLAGDARARVLLPGL